jgi:tetratricopeptide (TPR) repeat protein
VTIADVERSCAVGSALAAAHRDDDAIAAYKAALAKVPAAHCAAAGLQREARPWAGRVLDRIADAVPAVLEALALVVIAVFLVLMLGYFRFASAALARLPLIGRLLSPRLTLDAFDDAAAGTTKVGVPMAARIRERLGRFRDEALHEDPSADELDFGTAGEEFADLVSGDSGLRNALDKARDLSAQTKVVAALLDVLYALLPIRRLSVTGVLDPPDRNGASLTLALQSGGRLETAASIAGPALSADPTATDYLRLADPAAVWIQFEVARVLTRGVVSPNAAESYALVREGLDRHLGGDLDEARLAYEQALDLDPRNWAAAVNLTVALGRAGRYAAAVGVARQQLARMRQAEPPQGGLG